MNVPSRLTIRFSIRRTPKRHLQKSHRMEVLGGQGVAAISVSWFRVSGLEFMAHG